MTGEQIRQARHLLTLPSNSISSIARLLGVSRSTIYKHLPELADRHNPAAGQIRVTAVLPAPRLADARGQAGEVAVAPRKHSGRVTNGAH